jgi:hypothetical protein
MDHYAEDQFGRTVSVSGDVAIIGAYQDDDVVSNSGAAYIFERVAGTWVQTVKLTASDDQDNDRFGVSVSVSGDTAIVGAYYEDAQGSNAGAAYIFVRDGATWSEQQKLTASDGDDNDYFGYSVAVSGDKVIVGAYGNDDGGGSAGSAYIFARTGTTWAEQIKLVAPDPTGNDRFGDNVALDGDTALVDAFYDDDKGTNSGSVYVFVYNGISWAEQQKLTASDGAAGDEFGISVSVDGDTAIVGAYGNADLGDDTGSAYVFVRDGTTWTEQTKLTPSDAASGDFFGYSVSVSGDVAVVGAHLDDDNGDGSGSVYVFKRVGMTWSEQTKLTASDGAVGDRLGRSVSISGDTVIAGAYLDNENGNDSGSAYAYSCTQLLD